MTRDIEYYTVEDLTSKLKLSRRTIYNYLSRGELKGIKKGKYWYFTLDDINSFMNSGRG